MKLSTQRDTNLSMFLLSYVRLSLKVVPNLEFMVIAVTFHAQSIVKMTTATYKTERVINVIPDGKEQLVK